MIKAITTIKITQRRTRNHFVGALACRWT
jgi:hypothetical protein